MRSSISRSIIARSTSHLRHEAKAEVVRNPRTLTVFERLRISIGQFLNEALAVILPKESIKHR